MVGRAIQGDELVEGERYHASMPQSIPKGLNREHVLAAIADLDAGIEHSFGKPTGYELDHNGKRYPPKAVVGIAFRHLSGQILPPSDFSGGEAPGQANYVLRRLGFRVIEKEKAEASEESQAGRTWSSNEVQLIVEDYMNMLRRELVGESFSKADHNRGLREKLQSRSKGSVEYKHQNISAAMLELGLPYIAGYKPAQNYQALLLDAIIDYLKAEPSALQQLAEKQLDVPTQLPKLGSIDSLFEAPPDRSIISLPKQEPWRLKTGAKIDFAAREATNRHLGSLGEEFTVELERKRLKKFGRDDLAGKVEWVSQSRGDGLGFDVLSYDEDDESERWIEVKTTNLGKYFPFYVSSNEVRCSEAEPDYYHLYRLFAFKHQPKLYVLHGSLPSLCNLEPVQYRATL